MKRELGMAYCGLACCVCSENGNCEGCQRGGCEAHGWCKSYRCCKERGLAGCWECEQFPCESPMFEKLRVRCFAKLTGRIGQERLLDALERREAEGVVYHYPGQLVGDYDQAEDEDALCALLLGR